MPLFRRPSSARGRGTRSNQAVRVVTDSTSCLPVDTPEPGPHVVPLRVVTERESYDEGVDVTAADVVRMLDAGTRVTTSQPSPERFAETYRALADDGARAIVSLHLSGELSGTVGAASAAAVRSPLAVRVVDSRTVGPGLGFAARAAAECAAAGCDAAHVAARARAVADSSTSVFVVDTLEHLRRGGRLSGPVAALGTVLGVRPILTTRAGRIELAQRVRTRAAGMERLLDLAGESIAAATRPVVAVQHFGAPDRAGTLAGRLRTRTRAEVEISDISAVVGVHVGPGTLAVVVADLGDHEH
ncbi:DegV family protein [Myceligenerans pegani]|uniref:DegV family protein n=1 Tax=Myceligenerans pegani TaxID=2776917 RepID=A0ABR9N254_9MICO|nr:DegV family protein [Myceligenerans sp. TRM 65318]MBE1877738.1 DegV family protein [Myceligenerans sp. TRM 65318]MBE3020009.1 DegV family protein [Myceligenerans sp. TRM 65318]